MILDSMLDAPGDDAAGRAMLRLSLFDWTACALAGLGEPAAIAARHLLAPGEARLIGGSTGEAARVAMANATAGHALDYDDTHFDHIGHVSTVVLPAALALATDWEAFEAAALVGAEAAIRMGVWLGRGHYGAGFHQTATAGAFGATRACSDLLGLDRTATIEAFGLCASMASGLKAQFGTDGKPLNAGFAAAIGVDAARLASTGATAGAGAVQAFGATHAGDGNSPPSEPRFHAVSHKLHACCHGLHAALEAIRPHLGQPIDQVTVFTHPRWLSVCNQPAPATGLGAKFSYRTALALGAAGYDTADPASFADNLATDAEVIALRDRIEVLADETLSDTAARVRINDQVVTHDIATPLAFDVLTPRLRAKAAGLIGSAAAEPLWQAIEARNLSAYWAATAEASNASA